MIERRGRREEDREGNFYLQVHCTNGSSSQGWARLEPEACVLSWVPCISGLMYLAGGLMYLAGTSSAAFLGALAGSWIGSRVAGTQTNTLKWDVHLCHKACSDD